jgi:hypothetical protein
MFRLNHYNSFSAVEESNSGLGRLTVEVSRSHKIGHTHTHKVGFLCTSDQPVAEATRYLHNAKKKKKKKKSIPSAGFELSILHIKRPQIYALNCTVTGIGKKKKKYLVN